MVQCAPSDWIGREYPSRVFLVPPKDVSPAKPLESASFGPQRHLLRISAARPPNIPRTMVPFA